VVATAGTDAVASYNQAGTKIWAIPSTLVKFVDGLGGSAYELKNQNVLIASPARGGESQGYVTVVNRKANNTPILQLRVEGDAVRALPDSGGTEYWVLIDDRAGGRGSRLVRIDSSGKVKWSWGGGTLVHPTGLRMLPNGNILISE
jgi:hypothetical protein